MVMKKGRKVAMEASPSSCLWLGEEARARFRHKSLLQDYEKLLQPHVDFGLKLLGADIMIIPGLYKFVQALVLTKYAASLSLTAYSYAFGAFFMVLTGLLATNGYTDWALTWSEIIAVLYAVLMSKGGASACVMKARCLQIFFFYWCRSNLEGQENL